MLSWGDSNGNLPKLADSGANVRATRVALGLAALLAGPAQAAPAFTFALIGDLGYSERGQEVDHERQLAAVLDELNSRALALVVHDGDIGHPDEMCSDEAVLRRFAQFNALAAPFLYTSGDNEWKDCRSDLGEGRLSRLREVFFANDRTLGQRPLPLVRQSAPHRENARLQLGEVTIFTVHIVGSGNNLGTKQHTVRDIANRDWMEASFAAAKAARSRAVMLVMQANVFPYGFISNGYSAAFFDRLWQEVLGFAGPVVLVHGDNHVFQIDKPLVDQRNRVIENFTRVQTFGTPSHHWVEVVVDYDDPNVFQFRPRIVPANVAK